MTYYSLEAENKRFKELVRKMFTEVAATHEGWKGDVTFWIPVNVTQEELDELRTLAGLSVSPKWTLKDEGTVRGAFLKNGVDYAI